MDIDEGALIAKLGRKTGVTVGKYVGYGSTFPSKDDAAYENCIIVNSMKDSGRFCLPGDSGSLYLCQNRSCDHVGSEHFGKTYWRPIGIHRTSDGAGSYATVLSDSLKRLQIQKKLPDFTSAKVYCGFVELSEPHRDTVGCQHDEGTCSMMVRYKKFFYVHVAVVFFLWVSDKW